MKSSLSHSFLFIYVTQPCVTFWQWRCLLSVSNQDGCVLTPSARFLRSDRKIEDSKQHGTTVRNLKRSFNCPRSDKGQRDLLSQANRNRFNIASKVRLSWLIKNNCNAMIIIFSVVASALLASIIFLVITLVRKYHALADLRKLPGPRPNIFFGNAWQLPSNPEGTRTVYRSVFRLYLHVVKHLDNMLYICRLHLEFLLTKNFRNFRLLTVW